MTRQWILTGDSMERLRQLPDNAFDSLVTDPPAGIDFMGKDWDCFRRAHNPADVGRENVFGRTSRTSPHSYGESEREVFITMVGAIFAECLRVLRPGAHGLVWALPRTSHWTATALENAGFEIRDRFHDAAPVDGALDAFLTSLDDVQRDALTRLLESQSSPVFHHLFLNGMPKGQNVRRALDLHFCRLEGRHYDKNLPPETKRRPGDHLCPPAPEAEHREGWASGLKPTVEHWILVRKPLEGTQAKNQVKWGVGGINVDGCRVPLADGEAPSALNGGAYAGGTREGLPGDDRSDTAAGMFGSGGRLNPEDFEAPDGRWPRHMVLRHSAACRQVGVRKVKAVSGTAQGRMAGQTNVYGSTRGSDRAGEATGYGDENGEEAVEVWECVLGCPVRLLNKQTDDAAHLFNVFQDDVLYVAKAAVSEKEAGVGAPAKQIDDGRAEGSLGGTNPRNRGAGKRRSNVHPTVKPVALMRHLVRLVTPPGGKVLDPFAGSGTTLIAAHLEGCFGVGIERDPAYAQIAQDRIDHWTQAPRAEEPKE